MNLAEKHGAAVPRFSKEVSRTLASLMLVAMH